MADLIERLEADKQRLFGLGLKRMADDIAEAQAEIERLKAHKPDCDHAEHDSGGCLGYGRSEQDDEPIDACKKCEKYTGKDGDGE